MPHSPQDTDATRPEASEQPWRFALLAIITTVAILSVAMAVAALVPMLLGGFDPDRSLVPMGWLTWLVILASQITVVILVFAMADVGAGPAPPIPWNAPVGRWSWVAPVIATILISCIMAAVAFTFFPEVIARDLAPIRRMIEAGPLWLAFVALAIGAPVSEELLFRGYLLNRLKQTPLGFWWSALIANTGWTCLHFNYSWLGLADVFIAGLLLSWALWRTQSIWAPLVMHALYNAIVFAILLIPSSS